MRESTLLAKRQRILRVDGSTGVTEERQDRPTPEERARLEAAEQEALKILSQRMREGRWYPRRHQQFVLLVIFGLVAVVLVVAFVAYLFGS